MSSVSVRVRALKKYADKANGDVAWGMLLPKDDGKVSVTFETSKLYFAKKFDTQEEATDYFHELEKRYHVKDSTLLVIDV